MSAGYSMTLRNAQLDAITTAVGNAGFLRIYDGTQPATGGAATTLLAEFTLGTPYAPPAAAAVLSPTLPADTTGVTNGTATWFRVATSGGTQVADGTVGVEMILSSTSITSGGAVSVTSWTIARGNA